MSCISPFFGCLGPSLDSSWEVEIYLKKAEGLTPSKMHLDEQVIDAKFLAQKGCKTGLHYPAELEGQWSVPSGDYCTSTVFREESKLLYIPHIVRKNTTEAQEFLAEEQAIVMFKAALAGLTGGVALYATVNIASNLLKTILNTAAACVRIYDQTIQAWNDQGCFAAISTLVTRAVIDITYALAAGAWSIARVPFYAIAFEVALLYTLICPYDGRELAAKIERSWHYPLTPLPRNNAFYPLTIVRPGEDQGFLKTVERLNSCVYYFFFCFQPLQSLRRESRYVRLNRYQPPTL
jgi:hypothetical protein